MTGNCCAIIPAAGRGVRLAQGQSKAFVKLNDRTILEQAVERVSAAKFVNEIVICVPADRLELVKQMRLDKVRAVIEGGQTRQESVHNALEYLSQLSSPTWVVIHDAARCFVLPELIDRALEAAWEYSAVTAAIPVVDSLKRVKAGVVSASVDRSDLWAVQTPQAFSFELIRDMHRRANASGQNDYSDDVGLVEQEYPVRIILGDKSNIKITTPEDLVLTSE